MHKRAKIFLKSIGYALFASILLLSFLSYPQPAYSTGIGFQNFSGDVTVSNSTFTDNFVGIQFTTTNAASVANNTIDNIWIFSNDVYDSVRHGIKIDLTNTGAITIENNVLDNINAVDNGRFGIRVQNHQAPSIANNTVQNFGRSGIELLSITNITVTNNYLFSNGSQDYYTVVNGETLHNASGIQALHSTFSNVSYNMITSNRHSGISAYGTAGGPIGPYNTIMNDGDSGLQGGGGSGGLQDCVVIAGGEGAYRGGILVRSLEEDELMTVDCTNHIVDNYYSDVIKQGAGTLINCDYPVSAFFAKEDDAVYYYDEGDGPVVHDCGGSTINAAVDGASPPLPFGIIIVGAGSDVTVRNCTIKNAAMELQYAATTGNGSRVGAGIFISNEATPYIYSNYIVSNGWAVLDDRVYTEAGASGIQMRCAEANTSIVNNIIASNANDGLVGRETGGLIGAVNLGNTFRNNGRGGIGLYAGVERNLEIAYNDIYDNQRGIGINRFDGNMLTIANNLIRSNRGDLAVAGIGFTLSNMTVSITGNTLRNNTASTTLNKGAAGIGISRSTVSNTWSIANNYIFSNTYGYIGGIGFENVYSSTAATVSLVNNTILSNGWGGQVGPDIYDGALAGGVGNISTADSITWVVDSNTINNNMGFKSGAFGTKDSGGDISFTNNTVQNNMVYDYVSSITANSYMGPGVGLRDSTTSLYVYGSYFSGNTNFSSGASYVGGAVGIFWEEGFATTTNGALDYLTFESNKVTYNGIGALTVSGVRPPSFPGGPRFSLGSGILVSNNVFSDSSVSLLKIDGIYSATGPNTMPPLVISNNTFYNASGPGGLGGPSAVSLDRVDTFNNVLRDNLIEDTLGICNGDIPPSTGGCSTCSSGKGFNNNNGVGYLSITNNTIRNLCSSGMQLHPMDGVPGSYDGENRIYSNYLYNNGEADLIYSPSTGSVQVYGKGIGVSSDAVDGFLSIYNNTIESNKHGGIGFTYTDSAVVWANTVFNNTQVGIGFISVGNVTGELVISENVIYSNSNMLTAGSGGIGFSLSSGTITVTGNSIRNNTSSTLINQGTAGIGVADSTVSNTWSIANNYIFGNTYGYQGGIGFQNLYSSSAATVSLVNNNIISNGWGQSGTPATGAKTGGIGNLNTADAITLVVDSNNINNNIGLTGGGFGTKDSAGQISFSNNTVANNIVYEYVASGTTYMGPGLGLRDSTTSLYVFGSYFSGNTANNPGSGGYAGGAVGVFWATDYNPTAKISYVTVTSNKIVHNGIGALTISSPQGQNGPRFSVTSGILVSSNVFSDSSVSLVGLDGVYSATTGQLTPLVISRNTFQNVTGRGGMGGGTAISLNTVRTFNNAVRENFIEDTIGDCNATDAFCTDCSSGKGLNNNGGFGYLSFNNNTVQNLCGSGIQIRPINGASGDFNGENRIFSNYFYNNGRANIRTYSGGEAVVMYGHGIGVVNGPDNGFMSIYNNDLYSNMHRGIGFSTFGNTAVIWQNTVRNNARGGIGFDRNTQSGIDITVIGNQIYDNTNLFTNGIGGIGFNDGSGAFSVANNTIYNNTGQVGGIGVTLTNGTFSFVNNEIMNNVGSGLNASEKNVGGIGFNSPDNAATIYLSGNTLGNNQATVAGGPDRGRVGAMGVSFTNATVSMVNNTIRNNDAVCIGGVGFDLYGGSAYVSSNVIYSNTNNKSGWGAGGLAFDEASGTITIANNTIYNNTNQASGSGGLGINQLLSGASVLLDANDVYSNTGFKVAGMGVFNPAASSNVTISGNSLYNNAQSGLGVWGGSFINIENNYILSNGLSEQSKDDEFFGSGMQLRDSTFTNGDISGNTIRYNAFAGIANFGTPGIIGPDNVITKNGDINGDPGGSGGMEDCVVSGGSAGDIRGGILVRDLQGSEEMSIMCTNVVETNYWKDVAKTGGGTVYSCTNAVTSYFASAADAMYYYDETSGQVDHDCGGSVINANGKAFGIIILGAASDVTITNCTIKNAASTPSNWVDTGDGSNIGAGIFISNNATPSISNNYIVSNGWGILEDGNVNSAAAGIVMRCTEASTSIVNNTIASNLNDGLVARESGGLIGVVNEGNTFRNNGRGGIGVYESTTRNLEIAYNTINNNKRGVGALNFDGNQLTIANNVIFSNQGNSTINGGGIGVSASNGSISVINNTLTNNTASVGAGGIGLINTGNSFAFYAGGNIILNNSGGVAGGIGGTLGNADYIIIKDNEIGNHGSDSGIGFSNFTFTNNLSIVNNDENGGIHNNNFGISLQYIVGNIYIGDSNIVSGSGTGGIRAHYNEGITIANNTVLDSLGDSWSGYGFEHNTGLISIVNNTNIKGYGFAGQYNTGGITFSNNDYIHYMDFQYNSCDISITGNTLIDEMIGRDNNTAGGSTFLCDNNTTVGFGLFGASDDFSVTNNSLVNINTYGSMSGWAGYGGGLGAGAEFRVYVANNSIINGSLWCQNGEIVEFIDNTTINATLHFDNFSPDGLSFGNNTVTGNVFSIINADHAYIFSNSITANEFRISDTDQVDILANTLTGNELSIRNAVQVDILNNTATAPISVRVSSSSIGISIANNPQLAEVSINNNGYSIIPEILGNTISNATNYGLSVTLGGVSVANNYIYGSGLGGIQVNADNNAVIIQNNTIANNQKSGVSVTLANVVTIQNNIIVSNGSGTKSRVWTNGRLAYESELLPNNQVKLNTSSTTLNGYYDGMYLHLENGSGAPRTVQLSNYDGTTKIANVTPSWTTKPVFFDNYHTMQAADAGVRAIACADVIANNNVIRNNDGFGVAFADNTNVHSATVSDNYITSNSFAGISVGAYATVNNQGTFYIDDSLGSGNTLRRNGFDNGSDHAGGISFWTFAGTAHIDNNLIVSNRGDGTGNGGAGGIGFANYSNSADVAAFSITNNLIRNNERRGGGGTGIGGYAIKNSSELYVFNNVFSANNYATSGSEGQLAIDNSIMDVTIVSNFFKDGTTTEGDKHTVGLSMASPYDSTLLFSNNEIDANHGAVGGLYASQFKQMTVTGNTVYKFLRQGLALNCGDCTDVSLVADNLVYSGFGGPGVAGVSTVHGEGIAVNNMANNSVIRDNTAYNTSFGLRVQDSNFATIINNELYSNFDAGLAINNLHDSYVFSNWTHHNEGVGIQGEDTNNLVLVANVVEYNSVGSYTLVEENVLLGTQIVQPGEPSQFGVAGAHLGDKNMIRLRSDAPSTVGYYNNMYVHLDTGSGNPSTTMVYAYNAYGDYKVARIVPYWSGTSYPNEGDEYHITKQPDAGIRMRSSEGYLIVKENTVRDNSGFGMAFADNPVGTVTISDNIVVSNDYTGIAIGISLETTNQGKFFIDNSIGINYIRNNGLGATDDKLTGGIGVTDFSGELTINNNEILYNAYAGIQAFDMNAAGIEIAYNEIRSNSFAGIAFNSVNGNTIGPNNNIQYNGDPDGDPGAGGGLQDCVQTAGGAGNVRGGILVRNLMASEEMTVMCTNTIQENYFKTVAKTGSGTVYSCGNVITSYFAIPSDSVYYYEGPTTVNLDCGGGVIDAAGKPFGIVILGSDADVTVSNCTIKNAASDPSNWADTGDGSNIGAGIFISNNATPSISNNYIYSNGWGILQDGQINSAAAGIMMRCTEASTSIVNNTIASNLNDGLVARESGGLIGVVSKGNTFRNNGRSGIGLRDGTSRNIEIAYNEIHNNSRGIGVIDYSGNSFSISHNIIYSNKGNTSSEGGIGFNNFSSTVVIDENSIYDNRYGIGFAGATASALVSIRNNQIYGNTGDTTKELTNKGLGIAFGYGAPLFLGDVVIFSNRIDNNRGAAIGGSNDVSADGNPTMSGSFDITYNTIQNNLGYDRPVIGLRGISSLANISNNYIFSNNTIRKSSRYQGNSLPTIGIAWPGGADITIQDNIINSNMVSFEAPQTYDSDEVAIGITPYIINQGGLKFWGKDLGEVLIDGNTVHNNDVGYANNSDMMGIHYVNMLDGSNINITNNDIEIAGQGIGFDSITADVAGSNTLNVDNNRIFSSNYYFFEARHNYDLNYSISNNIFVKGNYLGMRLDLDDKQYRYVIIGNSMSNVKREGMEIKDIHGDFIFSANTIDNAGWQSGQNLAGVKLQDLYTYNKIGRITNNSFINNSTGPGLEAQASYVTIEGNLMENNGNGLHGSEYDAGLALRAPRNVTVTNNTMRNNDGGGIGMSELTYTWQGASLYNNFIVSNSEAGIGIGRKSGTGDNDGTIIIGDGTSGGANIVRNNNDGGIGVNRLGSSTVTIDYNTITNNSSDDGAGGIGVTLANAAATVSIANNVIDNNISSVAGGIGFNDCSGTIYIEGNMILSNSGSAGSPGGIGGFNCSPTSFTVKSTTTRNNTGIEQGNGLAMGGLTGNGSLIVGPDNSLEDGIAFSNSPTQDLTVENNYFIYGVAVNDLSDVFIVSNDQIDRGIAANDLTSLTIRNNDSIIGTARTRNDDYVLASIASRGVSAGTLIYSNKIPESGGYGIAVGWNTSDTIIASNPEIYGEGKAQIGSKGTILGLSNYGFVVRNNGTIGNYGIGNYGFFSSSLRYMVVENNQLIKGRSFEGVNWNMGGVMANEQQTLTVVNNNIGSGVQFKNVTENAKISSNVIEGVARSGSPYKYGTVLFKSGSTDVVSLTNNKILVTYTLVSSENNGIMIDAQGGAVSDIIFVDNNIVSGVPDADGSGYFGVRIDGSYSSSMTTFSNNTIKNFSNGGLTAKEFKNDFLISDNEIYSNGSSSGSSLGGIGISQANAIVSITGNTIRNNISSTTSNQGAAGIGITGSTVANTWTIADNYIFSNTLGYMGAVGFESLYSSGSAQVSLTNNSIISNGWGVEGDGAMAGGIGNLSTSNISWVLDGNTISNNRGYTSGAFGTKDGGGEISFSNNTVTNNLVYEYAASGTAYMGPGIGLRDSTTSLYVYKSYFAGNTSFSSGSGGYAGGAVGIYWNTSYNPPDKISYLTFVENKATYNGRGALTISSPQATNGPRFSLSSGILVSNNVFSDSSVSLLGMHGVYSATTGTFTPLIISKNTFNNANGPGGAIGGTAISLDMVKTFDNKVRYNLVDDTIGTGSSSGKGLNNNNGVGYLSIYNNSFTNLKYSGIQMKPMDGFGSVSGTNRIYSNYIFNNGWADGSAGDNNYGHGIGIRGTAYTAVLSVYNNTIESNKHRGIGFYDTPAAVVFGNTIKNSGLGGIGFRGSGLAGSTLTTGMSVYSNWIWGTTSTYGIYRTTANSGSPSYGNDIYFEDNFVYTALIGMYNANAASSTTFSVMNNTVSGSSDSFNPNLGASGMVDLGGNTPNN